MASIEKRGNSYRITVSTGRDVNGKKTREQMTYTPKAKGPVALEKELAAVARDFERQVLDGKYLTGEKLTFQAVAQQWFTECAPEDLADAGARNMDIIKRYAYPAFGTLQISKITTMHIQKLISEMKAKGLAPASIRLNIAAINSVFRYAFRMRIIQENPCTRDRIVLPKMKVDTELHYFTAEQARRFLDFLSVPYTKTIKEHTTIGIDGKPCTVPTCSVEMTVPLQHRVFFTLAIYGGLRRGELGALTWQDIDYDAKTVTINKSVARRDSGQIVKAPKTEHSYRTITLPDECFTDLRRWQFEQMSLRLKLGSAWHGNQDLEQTTIFMQDDGAMMDISSARRRFLSILKRYNDGCDKEEDKLPIIKLHDLRHTMATLLMAEGCDIKTIQTRMGHSKASVTTDVYAHAMPENDVKASNILSEALSKKTAAS